MKNKIITLLLVTILNLSLSTPRANAEVIFVVGGLTSDLMCDSGHRGWCLDPEMDLGTIAGGMAAGLTYLVGGLTSAIVGIWNPEAGYHIWIITKVLDEKANFNQSQLEGTLHAKYGFINNQNLIKDLALTIQSNAVIDEKGNAHISLDQNTIKVLSEPYDLDDTEIQTLISDFR